MKHLILIAIFLTALTSHAAPWLCGETDVIYDSQSFCASACGGDCVEMTPDGGTCSGTYKNYAFDRATNKTYALSVSKGKWADFSSDLAIIRDARTNDILRQILSFTSAEEAWIGLYDPNMTPSYNSINDTRFKWRDGTVLSFRNWEPGEPNNALNPSDIGNTDVYGEHYATIYPTGLWNDRHENILANALVEFAGVQSCVSGTLDKAPVQPVEMENAYCDGDDECNLCSDDTEIYKCDEYPGGSLCAAGQTECDPLYQSAICPAGTYLNHATDLCEKQVNIQCPSGMTYDSGLDRCVMPAACSGGGILNPVSDMCEKVMSSASCPSGYSFNAAQDVCLSSPDCPAGSYNNSTDRCELSAAASCPSGYTRSGSKCERNPTCPSGTSYNAGLNKCVSEAQINCMSGTTYNASYNLCYVPGLSIVKSGYIAGIYQLVLGRQPDIPGYNYWASRFSAPATENNVNSFIHGATGTACGRTVMTSDEKSLMALYVWYLGRCPDSEGWIYWRQNGWTRSQWIAGAQDDPQCQSSGCPNPPYLQNQCPSGTYYNSAYNLCGTNPGVTCPAGGSYDSAIGMCVVNPTCSSGGSLNGSTDKCEISVTYTCPSGMTYNSGAGKCIANPICSIGVYDAAQDICRISASNYCPSGYSYDAAQNKCLRTPSCPSGSYSVTADKCTAAPAKSCPAGTAMTSFNLCTAAPSCAQGTYDPAANGCFSGYGCPYSGQECVDVNGGVPMCSPYDCYSSKDPGPYHNEDTDEGANDKKADGEVDDAGQCLGTIYIFNGGDRRCRKPGVQTGFTDCCKDKDSWFGLSECKPAEQALATLRDWGEVDGQCHYVGEYCSEKWLTVCVQKKKTYCCFGSALARIIGEQGRQQLGIGWGTPKSPECRGFTPEEFQKLDFDKIDFSEWFEHYVEPEMQQNINENIRNAFENIPIPVVQ